MKTSALTILAALLLAPLAALHAGGGLPGVPVFGQLRDGFFQSLETCGALTSNSSNRRIK